jgi:hypothetical protein
MKKKKNQNHEGTKRRENDLEQKRKTRNKINKTSDWHIKSYPNYHFKDW